MFAIVAVVEIAVAVSCKYKYNMSIYNVSVKYQCLLYVSKEGALTWQLCQYFDI